MTQQHIVAISFVLFFCSHGTPAQSQEMKNAPSKPSQEAPLYSSEPAQPITPPTEPSSQIPPSSQPSQSSPWSSSKPVEVHTCGEKRACTATERTLRQRGFELRPTTPPADILTSSVPGLYTVQHQGGGKADQYFLRGFDADHGTDFAIYVDGIPVNI